MCGPVGKYWDWRKTLTGRDGVKRKYEVLGNFTVRDKQNPYFGVTYCTLAVDKSEEVVEYYNGTKKRLARTDKEFNSINNYYMGFHQEHKNDIMIEDELYNCKKLKNSMISKDGSSYMVCVLNGRVSVVKRVKNAQFSINDFEFIQKETEEEILKLLCIGKTIDNEILYADNVIETSEGLVWVVNEIINTRLFETTSDGVIKELDSKEERLEYIGDSKCRLIYKGKVYIVEHDGELETVKGSKYYGVINWHTRRSKATEEFKDGKAVTPQDIEARIKAKEKTA